MSNKSIKKKTRNIKNTKKKGGNTTNDTIKMQNEKISNLEKKIQDIEEQQQELSEDNPQQYFTDNHYKKKMLQSIYNIINSGNVTAKSLIESFDEIENVGTTRFIDSKGKEITGELTGRGLFNILYGRNFEIGTDLESNNFLIAQKKSAMFDKQYFDDMIQNIIEYNNNPLQLTEVEPGEVETTEIETVEVEPGEVETTEIETVEVEPGKVEKIENDEERKNYEERKFRDNFTNLINKGMTPNKAAAQSLLMTQNKKVIDIEEVDKEPQEPNTVKVTFIFSWGGKYELNIPNDTKLGAIQNELVNRFEYPITLYIGRDNNGEKIDSSDEREVGDVKISDSVRFFIQDSLGEAAQNGQNSFGAFREAIPVGSAGGSMSGFLQSGGKKKKFLAKFLAPYWESLEEDNERKNIKDHYQQWSQDFLEYTKPLLLKTRKDKEKNKEFQFKAGDLVLVNIQEKGKGQKQKGTVTKEANSEGNYTVKLDGDDTEHNFKAEELRLMIKYYDDKLAEKNSDRPHQESLFTNFLLHSCSFNNYRQSGRSDWFNIATPVNTSYEQYFKEGNMTVLNANSQVILAGDAFAAQDAGWKLNVNDLIQKISSGSIEKIGQAGEELKSGFESIIENPEGRQEPEWDKITSVKTSLDIDVKINEILEIFGETQKIQLLKSLLLNFIVFSQEQDREKLLEGIENNLDEKFITVSTGIPDEIKHYTYLELIKECIIKGWSINEDDLPYGFFKIIPDIQTGDTIINMIKLNMDFKFNVERRRVTESLNFDHVLRDSFNQYEQISKNSDKATKSYNDDSKQSLLNPENHKYYHELIKNFSDTFEDNFNNYESFKNKLRENLTKEIQYVIDKIVDKLIYVNNKKIIKPEDSDQFYITKSNIQSVISTSEGEDAQTNNAYAVYGDLAGITYKKFEIRRGHQSTRIEYIPPQLANALKKSEMSTIQEYNNKFRQERAPRSSTEFVHPYTDLINSQENPITVDFEYKTPHKKVSLLRPVMEKIKGILDDQGHSNQYNTSDRKLGAITGILSALAYNESDVLKKFSERWKAEEYIRNYVKGVEDLTLLNMYDPDPDAPICQKTTGNQDFLFYRVSVWYYTEVNDEDKKIKNFIICYRGSAGYRDFATIDKDIAYGIGDLTFRSNSVSFNIMKEIETDIQCHLLLRDSSYIENTQYHTKREWVKKYLVTNTKDKEYIGDASTVMGAAIQRHNVKTYQGRTFLEIGENGGSRNQEQKTENLYKKRQPSPTDIESAVEEEININFYSTGHSLGGYLALRTTFESIKNENWININFTVNGRQYNPYNNYITPIVFNPYLGSQTKTLDWVKSLPKGKVYRVTDLGFFVSSEKEGGPGNSYGKQGIINAGDCASLNEIFDLKLREKGYECLNGTEDLEELKKSISNFLKIEDAGKFKSEFLDIITTISDGKYSKNIFDFEDLISSIEKVINSTKKEDTLGQLFNVWSNLQNLTSKMSKPSTQSSTQPSMFSKTASRVKNVTKTAAAATVVVAPFSLTAGIHARHAFSTTINGVFSAMGWTAGVGLICIILSLLLLIVYWAWKKLGELPEILLKLKNYTINQLREFGVNLGFKIGIDNEGELTTNGLEKSLLYIQVILDSLLIKKNYLSKQCKIGCDAASSLLDPAFYGNKLEGMKLEIYNIENKESFVEQVDGKEFNLGKRLFALKNLVDRDIQAQLGIAHEMPQFIGYEIINEINKIKSDFKCYVRIDSESPLASLSNVNCEVFGHQFDDIEGVGGVNQKVQDYLKAEMNLITKDLSADKPEMVLKELLQKKQQQEKLRKLQEGVDLVVATKFDLFGNPLTDSEALDSPGKVNKEVQDAKEKILRKKKKYEDEVGDLMENVPIDNTIINCVVKSWAIEGDTGPNGVFCLPLLDSPSSNSFGFESIRKEYSPQTTTPEMYNLLYGSNIPEWFHLVSNWSYGYVSQKYIDEMSNYGISEVQNFEKIFEFQLVDLKQDSSEMFYEELMNVTNWFVDYDFEQNINVELKNIINNKDIEKPSEYNFEITGSSSLIDFLTEWVKPSGVYPGANINIRVIIRNKFTNGIKSDNEYLIESVEENLSSNQVEKFYFKIPIEDLIQGEYLFSISDLKFKNSTRVKNARIPYGYNRRIKNILESNGYWKGDIEQYYDAEIFGDKMNIVITKGNCNDSYFSIKKIIENYINTINKETIDSLLDITDTREIKTLVDHLSKQLLEQPIESEEDKTIEIIKVFSNGTKETENKHFTKKVFENETEIKYYTQEIINNILKVVTGGAVKNTKKNKTFSKKRSKKNKNQKKYKKLSSKARKYKFY
jgi:uncharacterized cupredoxin-like copper-binding protein